ncbi:hypothetical protein [Pantoea sp. AS-PWVM4]|uniref:hypothetical protein n=1 Tax=Pantoea sp. AS-PWVM4 TaxID=1332069 RepID=UPI0013765355|nr:hypothetical protein [Pantoea sp. AS-PWVM4]
MNRSATNVPTETKRTLPRKIRVSALSDEKKRAHCPSVILIKKGAKHQKGAL